MKKRNFLLIEILIAFVLVMICIVPLVKQPLKLYKDEMAYLEKMELERLADWTFIEVKELLLKNEIPWEKIPPKKMETDPFPLASSTIHIPGNKPRQVSRSFTLKGRGEKTGPKDQIYRQLGVYIFLNGQRYEFRLPIERVFVE
jgi:hypothetical protein